MTNGATVAVRAQRSLMTSGRLPFDRHQVHVRWSRFDPDAALPRAFESMLTEFDPDRLQEQFDRQLSKGLVPAKLRYWDLFRERHGEIARDPQASFHRLFGEEFARAYEEQLQQLE